MTKLLLIRHGQSQANIENFFAGHLDSPLTELGIRQAKLTADYIAGTWSVDRVYASDLRRAYVTGKAVADRFGLDIIADHDLREIWAGHWEGKSYVRLSELFPETYGVWLTDIGHTVCDEGESVAQLQQRVLDAVFRICQANPDATVVIATHATPIRSLQCYCEGKTLDEMKDVPWVSNASVTELIYENNRLRLGEVNYDAHLGSLISALPENC